MSDGRPIPWAEAFCIAEMVSKRLAPLVVRLKAVGSLRRKRPVVSDIEFIVEPKMIGADLFGTQVADVLPVKAALIEMGTWVQGADRAMRITNLQGREGLKLELYLIHPPADWAAQLGIRTGPWELGREVMTRLQEHGYGHTGGHVINAKTGEVVATPDEETWFGLARLPCLPPEHRDDFARELIESRARANAALAKRRTG